jgi:hypothetical protein
MMVFEEGKGSGEVWNVLNPIMLLCAEFQWPFYSYQVSINVFEISLHDGVCFLWVVIEFIYFFSDGR